MPKKSNCINLTVPQLFKIGSAIVAVTIFILNYNTRFVSVEKSVRALDSIQTVAIKKTASNDKKLDIIVAYLQGKGVMPDKIPEYEGCLTVASISDTIPEGKEERITCKNKLADGTK